MKKIKSEAGFTIILFLALLLMLTLAGINAVMTSTTDVDIAGNEMNHSRAFYAAEAGLEKGTALIENSYRVNGAPPHPLPSGQILINQGGYSGAEITVDYSVQQISTSTLKNLKNGAYEGLYAYATEFEVSSDAYTTNSQMKTDLRMAIESDLIPIYQFAVFYEGLLEMSPGPAMTLGGHVHSNKDVFIQSGNSLQLSSHLTSAGDIFHGAYPGSGQGTFNGDVLITDRDGNLRSMYQNGGWVDANASDWIEHSISLWGGMVEDVSHGITELNLPVVRSGDPIDMIKTAGESVDSYENNASLKIVNGKAIQVDADGKETNVTAHLVSLGVISYNTFYDGRENKTVTSLDINIGALNASGYWPRNGIIYTAQDQTAGDLKATRLVNGSTLSSGLTVATKNPLYIQGDYNTVAKKPAAVMADATTILSNAWTDADGALGLYDLGRKATATSVNVSFMTGNIPSENGMYSGGLENLPRFLENWTNIAFTWKGSAVDLWQSEQATGRFLYSTYCTAPDRNWAFDTDLLDVTKLPPGTPLISIVQKTGWREVVAYHIPTEPL
jgi:hypothetical protein